mgnify:CR=1 FL=1
MITCPICFNNIIPTIQNIESTNHNGPRFYSYLYYNCTPHTYIKVIDTDFSVREIKLDFHNFFIEGVYLHINDNKVHESVWNKISLDYTINDIPNVINQAKDFIKYQAFL